MIDTRNKLTVLIDDNTSFIDVTEKAADFLRDEFAHDFVATEDYLYLGFKRPFSAAYVELIDVSTAGAVATLEVYDGSTWVDATLQDETAGLSRSGFWQFSKDEMTQTEVNGTTLFWARVSFDVTTGAVAFRGINIVFSDDAALKAEFFDIDNPKLLPSGQASHISAHVAARNHIIQKLRNQNYIKVNASTGLENLTPWDLLDIHEVKSAACYLALSKIFFVLSDNPEDNYWTKYREYQDKFEEAFRLATLSIDNNDDGIPDSDEKSAPIRATRWNR